MPKARLLLKNVVHVCPCHNIKPLAKSRLFPAPPSLVHESVFSTSSRDFRKRDPCGDCRRALVDIPPPVDPECPMPCERQKMKPKGILQRIKLRIVEGGTNFGTPFRRLRRTDMICPKEEPPEKEEEKALVPKIVPEIPEPRPGVQVTILGADTCVGQYVSLLLKQCPQIKKLRLYEARDTCCDGCSREIFSVAQDLQHIDTNCLVQAFTCKCGELELALQNTDIVLMLESAYSNANMSYEKRFMFQAPIVKHYAELIASECPKAMVIVCATPIDCMVPLVAETMKETGWYDKRKLIGSMAVPEMRASTLAARALNLEPRYTRVPCVGGTEGHALVPLFSKAVSYFDFARHNAEMLTDTVRFAPQSVARCECCCMRSADLSEAHALAGMVKSIAHALLCQDVPRISGFVETDASQILSPARFLANEVEISINGIKNLGLPAMVDREITDVNLALKYLSYRLLMVHDWYCRYLALEMLVNRHGICKKYDIPGLLSEFELDLMDVMWSELVHRVEMAKGYHRQAYNEDWIVNETDARANFHIPAPHDRVHSCNLHLTRSSI